MLRSFIIEHETEALSRTIATLLVSLSLVTPVTGTTATSAAQTAATSQKVEEGFIATEDGTKLFYQKVGSGPKTVVLPLRLFTFEAFKQLGDQYTVIAYDTRGRGRSEPIPDNEKPRKLSIQHDVADLEQVRQHFHLKRMSLIGYSYTGLIIVMYAMDHSDCVERLIQLGPIPIKFGTKYPENLVARDNPGDPKLLHELRRLRSEENYHVTHPKEYCEQEWAYSRVGLVGNPSNADKVTAQPCEMPNEYPVNLMKYFEASFPSVQKVEIPKAKVAAVKVPVLTIHGTKDRNAPYGAGREWALTLSNARLLTIEGGAHQTFDEFPDLVIPAVRRFLAGDWPDGTEHVTTLNPDTKRHQN